MLRLARTACDPLKGYTSAPILIQNQTGGLVLTVCFFEGFHSMSAQDTTRATIRGANAQSGAALILGGLLLLSCP